MEVTLIPALSDNYIFLISWDGKALLIDPATSASALDVIKKENVNVLAILNTHHHSDHVGGNEAIKKETGALIIGPNDPRIPGLDQAASEGKDLQIDSCTIEVISVPGHTSSHIAFFIPEKKWLFSGDSLFLGGCGRLFEGTPEQMLLSLRKLSQLPAETLVFCGHEYTEHNLEFALSVEPDNDLVKKRLDYVKSLRSRNQPSVPAPLSEELLTNPFLRVDQLSLREALKMKNASDLEVFTHLRKLKDNF